MLVILSFLFSERNKHQYVESTDFMGKQFTQIVYGKSEDCENVISLVKSESFKIEGIISSDFYNSDVDRINKSHGKWVKVEDVTINVIQKLIEISYNTDGIFNFVHLSGNQQDLNSLIFRRIKNLKFDMLEIDEQSKKIRMLSDDLTISLDDAVDGLICNKAIEIYKNQKIKKAKVHIGNISGYLNDDKSETRNGFICTCKNSDLSDYKDKNDNEVDLAYKFYHKNDAIVADILSKVYQKTNKEKFKKMLNFFT